MLTVGAATGMGRPAVVAAFAGQGFDTADAVATFYERAVPELCGWMGRNGEAGSVKSRSDTNVTQGVAGDVRRVLLRLLASELPVYKHVAAECPGLPCDVVPLVQRLQEVRATMSLCVVSVVGSCRMSGSGSGR